MVVVVPCTAAHCVILGIPTPFIAGARFVLLSSLALCHACAILVVPCKRLVVGWRTRLLDLVCEIRAGHTAIITGHAPVEFGAQFGRLAGKIPARRVPLAIERLVALYLAERSDGETANAFFSRAADRATAAISDLKELRPEDAAPEDFVEPGLEAPFAPETQEGECAA